MIEYPKHERHKIDTSFYNWKEYFRKEPFHCDDGKPQYGLKAKAKSYREFPLLGYGANIGLLNKYQSTWERKLKLYHLLLGIFFDYIHWRVVYSKNSIDFKMFLMKQDANHNNQIRLLKPSKAEFRKEEKHIMNNTRFRTQYVYRKVTDRTVDFTRSRVDAERDIKKLNDLVKKHPQTIKWKRELNK